MSNEYAIYTSEGEIYMRGFISHREAEKALLDILNNEELEIDGDMYIEEITQ